MSIFETRYFRFKRTQRSVISEHLIAINKIGKLCIKHFKRSMRKWTIPHILQARKVGIPLFYTAIFTKHLHWHVLQRNKRLGNNRTKVVRTVPFDRSICESRKTPIYHISKPILVQTSTLRSLSQFLPLGNVYINIITIRSNSAKSLFHQLTYLDLDGHLLVRQTIEHHSLQDERNLRESLPKNHGQATVRFPDSFRKETNQLSICFHGGVGQLPILNITYISRSNGDFNILATHFGLYLNRSIRSVCLTQQGKSKLVLRVKNSHIIFYLEHRIVL